MKDETALAAKSVDCTGLASTARASADAATVAGDPHLRLLVERKNIENWVHPWLPVRTCTESP